MAEKMAAAGLNLPASDEVPAQNGFGFIYLYICRFIFFRLSLQSKEENLWKYILLVRQER